MGGVDHALSTCLIKTDMSADAPLLPPQLLSDLNSLILRAFEAVDDGSSRSVTARVARFQLNRAHLKSHRLQYRRK